MPKLPLRAMLLAAAAALPVLDVAHAQLLTPPAASSHVTAPKIDMPASVIINGAGAGDPTPSAQNPAGAPGGAETAPSAETAKTVTSPNLMNEGVAALVNDDIISTYDLRQRMRLLVMTTGVQPTEQTLPQLEQEALRSLIDEHLQMQELKKVSKKQKIDLIAADKDVDDEIGDLAKQNNLSPAQMRTSFAASGIDIETMRDQIRTQLSWQHLISGMYGNRVRVGEDQVTASLNRISAQASKTQYLIGEIFIDAQRAGGMQEAITGADQLVAQIQQGAPFAGVARQFSASPTAASGGDAGWVSTSQVQPEVAKALDELRPGQLSAPIPVSGGVYIVYLREKQAASGQTMVGLKQLAVRLSKDASADQVGAAEAKLRALKPQVTSCTTIDAVAAKAPGVVSADLGEAEITDLRGPFKDAAETLQAGQVSDPIRTDVGVHLVAVCSKHAGDAKVPSRNEISNRLYAEQLSVMSKRYLRDLRNSATIEAR